MTRLGQLWDLGVRHLLVWGNTIMDSSNNGNEAKNCILWVIQIHCSPRQRKRIRCQHSPSFSKKSQHYCEQWSNPLQSLFQNKVGQSVNFTLYILSQRLPVNKTWSFPTAMPFSTFPESPLSLAGHNEDMSLWSKKSQNNAYQQRSHEQNTLDATKQYLTIFPNALSSHWIYT